ncbi:MAG TPA: hypothetical protein VM077_02045 [Candidatus Limnocylindrales bacterium]|nr:hypothetical protein [Candidatus Limnocylindrales bacterium]
MIKNTYNNSRWLEILKYGKYAPTPHNTQWYYLHVINQNKALVGIDSSISIPYTDPDDQFRFTGLGVFVAHLEYAAKAAGYSVRSTFHVNDSTFPVEVQITNTIKPDPLLAKTILQRRTSRLPYQKKKISDNALIELLKLSTKENLLHISSDKLLVSAVINLNNKILIDELRDKGLGDELSHWIRYTNHAQAQHQNGFTPDTLAVSGWKIWLILRFRWVVKISFMRQWLTRQYIKQNITGTVGWIYSSFATKQDQYYAGRFMMDLWIRVTELGFYMQPYGSIITNLSARKQFLKAAGQSEAYGKMVWLAFRVGVSDVPAASPRKPIEEYLR